MKQRTVFYRDGLFFLGVLIVVFLGAMVRQVNLLLLFASILACFVVLDFQVGRKLIKNLGVKRRNPGTPKAGEPFIVPVELTNTKKVPSWSLVVEDTITPLDGQDAEGVLNRHYITPFDAGTKKYRKKAYQFRPICYFDEVSANGSVSGSWAGILPRRGRYRLGPMTISSRFPLGFFRSSVQVPGETVFCVGPKIGHLSQKWVSILRERADDQSRKFSRVERFGEEMFGLRQWQSEDTRRSIHQRASAKHQKLLVRQFQRQTLQTTAIILDLFEPEENDSFEQLENRERAVSFAATLFAELYGKGKNPVAFGLNGYSRGMLNSDSSGLNPDSENGLFFCKSTAGNAAGAVITEHLATAKATKTDRLGELLAQADADGGMVSARVIITPKAVDLARRLEDRHAGFAAGAIIVDASTAEFDEIFQL